MEPTISFEEFQRFQTQLLNLREAQLKSNDQRLRAEAKVKQLEEELAKERKHSKIPINDSRKADRTQLDDLLKENKALRDKLQSTESSFQLHTSTLQAECHHLVSELSRLQERVNKPLVDEDSQTIRCSVVHTCTQTDECFDDSPTSSYETPIEVRELQTALDVSHATQDIYGKTLLALETKVNQLESIIQNEFGRLHKQTNQLQVERNQLETRVSQLKDSLCAAEEGNQTLQTKLNSVRQRSEKINRELRRQLSRLIRNQQSLDISEQISLRKSPTFSSSSSLSSFCHPNGHFRCGSDVSVTKRNSIDTQDSAGGEIPAGFFPMEDFRALVNRMSEVQEENCSLRRQLQCVQHQLMNNPTHHLPMQPSSSTEASYSFSFKVPSFSATPLSSDDVTLSRLKRLCEDLIQQNIKLSDELEIIRGKK